MLQATGITKSYGNLQVLKGVNISVQKGQIVSLVGASGAGKSTLLHILGTLDNANSGTFTINNQNVSALNAKALAAFRNQHIGFVFQFHHLLPEFTALENVCIPAWIAKKNTTQTQKRAIELLALLGLENRLQNKPNQLSGGEQQRVSVARALINNPSIILADEPSGNLDTQNAKELHQLFFTLRNELQQTFLIVTHNETLANNCDVKIEMRDGLVVGE
jgi:lipoprotein-releasing system ATP-binding protein